MATVSRPTYAVRISVRSFTAAVGSQGSVNRLALTAIPGAAPFSQTDWPNPQRRQHPIALRTHTNPFPVNLYGKDQFFGPPGMGPDYDYPNPRRAIRLNTGVTTSTLPLLLGQDVFFGPPGMGPDYDYPNPILARRAQQPQATSSPLALTATPIAAAPFAGRTFDNPRPAGRLWADLLRPQPLAIVAASPSPFAQSDWPNPALRRRALQPDSPPTQLPAIYATPLVSAAFDLPTRRPAPRQDFRHTTFAPFVIAAGGPFNQTGWPNPTLRLRRPVADFTSPNRLALAGQATSIRPGTGRLTYTGLAPTLLGLAQDRRLIPVVNNLEQLRKNVNAILGGWQVRTAVQASVPSAGQTVSNSNPVPYSDVNFDLQSEYSTGAYTFTAARGGHYRVHAMLYVSGLAAGKFMAISANVNGVLRALSQQDFNDTAAPRQASGQVTRILPLAAGDSVNIVLASDHVGALDIVGAPYSYFEIDQVNL